MSDIELYRGLEPILGPAVASLLIERLPAAPAGDLVTKDDLLATKADLRTELGAVRAEIGAVRAEISASEERMGLRLEVTEHRMTAAFRGELIEGFNRRGRQMALTLLGAMTGLSGLAWAIASLTH